MNKENNEIFKSLSLPFKPEDIEWRIAQKGAKNGKPWAKVLAYVTNRAIMNRLDEVCGPENWCNKFEHLQGAFLCGIGIKIEGEWIFKWDGAQESQIEATKGGISGAMKRAAVQWGIGRYLYGLTEAWADIASNGINYVGADRSKDIPSFKWNPPSLPEWALPPNKSQSSGKKTQSSDKQNFLIIKGELQGAFNIADLDGIMKNRKGMIESMPEAGTTEIYKHYEARLAEFESDTGRK